jgi:hypothetical protein
MVICECLLLVIMGKKYLLIFFSHYDMFLFPVTGVHIAVKMLLLRC